MFDRSKQSRGRFTRGTEDTAREGGVATATDAQEREETVPLAPPRREMTRETLDHQRARQREEFGGINWGSAFFGWLVAVGMAAILTGILSAAGAAIGLNENTADAETLSLAGAIALLVVLGLAYYCGGYVAGRMSRFDGGRQGLGVWAVGILITIALAALALVLGSEYNVLDDINLPALPIGEAEATTGGIVATVAILLGTLLAAMAGGKAGERFHRKVDRVAVER